MRLALSKIFSAMFLGLLFGALVTDLVLFVKLGKSPSYYETMGYFVCGVLVPSNFKAAFE